MSSIITCDKCEKSVENKINNSFIRLTLHIKTENGLEPVIIDLCPEDTDALTHVILNWVDEGKEESKKQSFHKRPYWG